MLLAIRCEALGAVRWVQVVAMASPRSIAHTLVTWKMVHNLVDIHWSRPSYGHAQVVLQESLEGPGITEIIPCGPENVSGLLNLRAPAVGALEHIHEILE